MKRIQKNQQGFQLLLATKERLNKQQFHLLFIQAFFIYAPNTCSFSISTI